MTDSPIKVTYDGNLAIITHDDPPLNLWKDETMPALHRAVDEVAASDARAVVWNAKGKVFSGGVDVSVFDRITDGAEAERFFAEGLVHLRAFETLEIPSLAIVHSLCLTASFETALSCDLIWAGESASFGLVEARVGLTPAGGGLQRVAERAGPARAREMVMTARIYPAEDMVRWGVVNRVLPDEELEEKGLAFAHKLADGPTKAHAATKKIVRAWLDDGIEKADEVTPAVAGSLFDTEDLKNAVKTFLAEGPGNATFENR